MVGHREPADRRSSLNLAVTALALLAVVLAWPVPRGLARLTSLRRAPRAALVLWQSSAVAAVLAALLAAPAAVLSIVEATPGTPGGARPDLTPENVALWPAPVATLITGVVAARLLFSGDRVGRRLRAARRRHRDLVDLLAVDDIRDAADDGRMRVLEHSTPTAYCVPGLARRVVVTRGTLDSLGPDELTAVLSHERAHLTARHDLVLEFFTVMHEAVPRFMRSVQALHSVTLLIEVLADRAAVRSVGVVATARAIVAMVGGPRPEGALGMSGSGPASVSDARLRIELLEGGRVIGLPNAVASGLMYAASGLLVAAPVALLLAALPTTQH
ncbi:MAG: M56 family metallopeptidase [Humibacillus sp.]|nr:M56 family metallopeptidase [Humibacillus sp.]MDN5779806.1 M56 family metallopeptidase [Humibacillus sp.]